MNNVIVLGRETPNLIYGEIMGFFKTDLEKQARKIITTMRGLEEYGKEQLREELGLNRGDLINLENELIPIANGADFKDRAFLDRLERVLDEISSEEQKRKTPPTQKGPAQKGPALRGPTPDMQKIRYYESGRYKEGYFDLNKGEVEYNNSTKRWEKVKKRF